MANKWFLFSEKEREDIMNAYNNVIDKVKKKKKITNKEIREAARGMSLSKRESLDKQFDNIINTEGKYPIIHEDSMTAWVNRATELYGLTVGDIVDMKFGDTIKVIMMDRNIGDYTFDLEPGTVYDPKKIGLSYGTYIHGEELTGLLNFDNGVVLAPFEWEINMGALKSNWYWGPCDCDISKLNKKIKVGWRGCAIKVSDAKKYMPNKVVHYGTWWDDYGVIRYHDLLRLK